MRDEGDWEGMDLWREEEKRAEGQRGLEEQREGGPSSREDARGTKRENFFSLSRGRIVSGKDPQSLYISQVFVVFSFFFLLVRNWEPQTDARSTRRLPLPLLSSNRTTGTKKGVFVRRQKRGVPS